MKLLENLIDPGSKEKLVLDWENGSIEGLNEEAFTGEIRDGIPVILPRTREDSEKKTAFHSDLDSSFDYVDHYKKDAEVFDYFQEIDKVTKSERKRLNQKVARSIHSDAKTILDVGCGNGWLSKMIQGEHNTIVSLDIAFINVKKTLQNQPHPNHIGIVTDVFHLPFPDNTFDTIIASEIIEHTYDPAKFIHCLFRILKPQGQLLITTPYNEKIPVTLCVHCNKPTPRNAHLHSFNDENIINLIPSEASKWKTEKISNHYLVKARLIFILNKLPFLIWSWIDSLANRIFKKPTRFIIQIIK